MILIPGLAKRLCMHALLALADAEGGERKTSHLELEYAHSADATSIKAKRKKKDTASKQARRPPP